MQSIFSLWHFDLLTTAFLILLCWVYLYAQDFKLKKQSLYFFAGVILLMLCVSSPLHFIGQHYLFSAHMLSHVLMLLIVAPLIVAGISGENKFKKQFLFLSRKINKRPLLAWLSGVSIMWFWHIPYISNHLLTMQNTDMSFYSVNILMSIHMISLLVAGIIFCWPVITPYYQYRIAPLKGVLYLSTACGCCSLLGLLITFAPAGNYTYYINTMDVHGYLSVVRNNWKISAADDQQIAGLIMWVPCCFIYLTASMILLVKWFDNKNGITVLKKTNILK